MKQSSRRVLIIDGVVYVLLALIVTSFFYSVSPNGYDTQGFDQSCFYTIGRGILNGAVPYVDFYDNKGPLTYLLFAGIALFDNYKISVFAAQMIINLISIVILSAFLKEIGANKSRFAIIIFFFVYYIFISAEPGLYTEDIVIPLLLMSYLFTYKVIKYYGKEKSFIPKYSYVVSIAFWLVLLIRINNAIIIAGLLFAIGIMLLANKNFKDFFTLIISFVVIGVILCLPVIIWLAKENALYDCLYESFLINFEYSSALETVPKKVLFFGFNSTFCFCLWGMLIYGILGLFLYYTKVKKGPEKWFSFAMLVALVFSIIAISTITFSYYHYLTTMVVSSFMPFMINLSKLLSEDTKANRITRTVFLALMIVTLVGLFVKDGCNNTNISNKNDAVFSRYQIIDSVEDTVFYEIGEMIPDEDKDSVFAIDENPKFYSLNKIQPCKRILVCRNLFTYVNEDLHDEYLSYFAEDEPKWLVIRNGIENIEDDELADILNKRYKLFYQSQRFSEDFYCLYVIK
ncbi:MAG: hypothetical protein ACI4IN_01735 [Eubacterium sp.]